MRLGLLGRLTLPAASAVAIVVVTTSTSTSTARPAAVILVLAGLRIVELTSATLSAEIVLVCRLNGPWNGLLLLLLLGIILLRLLLVLLIWLLSLWRSGERLRPIGIDWSWNTLWVVVDIQRLVDDGWNGLDLGAEVLLNVVEVKTIIPVDQVDSQTKMTIPSGSTNTMQIRLRILGEVEVDNHIYSLDINTTSEEIRADQVPADAVTEIMEHSVSGMLGHLSVTVETRVAKFGNLLSQKLDPVSRVTEDNRLVDLKLGEESVQAVHLLLLFDEGVVLRDTPECKLIHQVDLVGFRHVLVGKVLDGYGEGGGEQHDLAILRMELKQLLDNGGEFDR